MFRRSKAHGNDTSATDAAVGGLLSWVAGKDSTRRGVSATDGAVGEILSWVVGRGGRNSKRY